MLPVADAVFKELVISRWILEDFPVEAGLYTDHQQADRADEKSRENRRKKNLFGGELNSGHPRAVY